MAAKSAADTATPKTEADAASWKSAHEIGGGLARAKPVMEDGAGGPAFFRANVAHAEGDGWTRVICAGNLCAAMRLLIVFPAASGLPERLLAFFSDGAKGVLFHLASHRENARIVLDWLH
jgi:hypothetical protein